MIFKAPIYVILLVLAGFINPACYAVDPTVLSPSIGGGPPARELAPPSDSLTRFDQIPRLENTIQHEAIVCRESPTRYRTLDHTSATLERWPLSANSNCLVPLEEFSRKLSLSKAPLALSFATFVDGLKRHFDGGSIRFRNCTSGCQTKLKVKPSCVEPQSLIQRTLGTTGGDHYTINLELWNELSGSQPRVCAGAVVDLWLSQHVNDQDVRRKMVSDFFSARFHMNKESNPACFDPTLATMPIESFDRQMRTIIRRIPR